MPILNFKEIPEANTGNGDQDTFELFAREFFQKVLKFEIKSEPNRGADGGKDIIAIEHQTGHLSSNEFVWLISCKHNAHSGKSVNENDEQNITDRLAQHKANGFIGFYSTLPSSGLNNRLDAIKDKYKVSVFNHERIESNLIDNECFDLIRRFFPNSYKNISIKEPSVIFDKYEPLQCSCCGKDLLKDLKNSNIVFLEDIKKQEYVDVFVCCKGTCDKKLIHKKRLEGYVDSWEDLDDLAIPMWFMRYIMSFLNNIRSGKMRFSDDAFYKLKIILLRLSQCVVRKESDKEKDRIKELLNLPDGI